MTDRELAKIVYDALLSVAKGIARKYGFGEFRNVEKRVPITQISIDGDEAYVTQDPADGKYYLSRGTIEKEQKG